jgi:hypothetical protein
MNIVAGHGAATLEEGVAEGKNNVLLLETTHNLPKPLPL